MIYTLSGRLQSKGDGFLVVDVGGVGLKVFVYQRFLRALPDVGENINLYSYLYVRENVLELYGFPDEKSRKLFEMLDSVSGIGPKTALGVLDNDSVDRIIAAIVEKRADFLTRTSGIGRKTAERVILELHSKFSLPKAGEVTKAMDVDNDIEDTLHNLGYSRREVKDALTKLGPKPEKLEERLKEALRILSK